MEIPVLVTSLDALSNALLDYFEDNGVSLAVDKEDPRKYTRDNRKEAWKNQCRHPFPDSFRSRSGSACWRIYLKNNNCIEDFQEL